MKEAIIRLQNHLRIIHEGTLTEIGWIYSLLQEAWSAGNLHSGSTIQYHRRCSHGYTTIIVHYTLEKKLPILKHVQI